MTTRRNLFGWLAGAPIAAIATKEAISAPVAEKPEFFIGQIRAVHSHYEPKLVPRSMVNSYGYSFSAMATESVAVVRYEQWDGNDWQPIDGATPPVVVAS